MRNETDRVGRGAYRGGLWAIARVLGCVLVTLCFRLTASASELPRGWEAMEIEAKWKITLTQYDELVAAFREGGEWQGFDLNVRWSGISRKFVDVYYDTPALDLASALHSIRHRIRFRSNPRAPSNALGALQAANWDEDWQRLQYKSTPCRIDSVWFRAESGACKLADANPDDARLCAAGLALNPATLLAGHRPSHDAVDAMVSDHPGLVLPSLAPRLHVLDYRYRVELRVLEEAVFELSLDRARSTDLYQGGVSDSFEAELEIISDVRTSEQVVKLLALAATLQQKFLLTPSTRSKGGVEVGACQLPE